MDWAGNKGAWVKSATLRPRIVQQTSTNAKFSSGWTTLNSVTTAAVTNPSHLRIAKTNAGALQLHGVYKTAPSVPYAALIKITDYTSIRRGNFTNYGLGIGDSTPTAWMTFSFGSL